MSWAVSNKLYGHLNFLVTLITAFLSSVQQHVEPSFVWLYCIGGYCIIIWLFMIQFFVSLTFQALMICL